MKKQIKKTIVTVLVALVAITSINAKTLYKDKKFELRNGHKAEVTLQQKTLVEYDDVNELFSGKFQALTFTRYNKAFNIKPKLIIPVSYVDGQYSLDEIKGTDEFGVWFGMNVELSNIFDKLDCGESPSDVFEVTNGVEVWELDIKADNGVVQHLEYIFNVLSTKANKIALCTAVIFYEK